MHDGRATGHCELERLWAAPKPRGVSLEVARRSAGWGRQHRAARRAQLLRECGGSVRGCPQAAHATLHGLPASGRRVGGANELERQNRDDVLHGGNQVRESLRLLAIQGGQVDLPAQKWHSPVLRVN